VGVFLTALLTTSLAMSAVILLLLLLNKILAAKLSAMARYRMWIIILIGLLIPFRPSIPVPYGPVQLPMSFDTASISAAIDESIQYEAPQALSLESSASPEAFPIVPSADKPSIPYSMILLGIWLAGALAALAYHLRIYGKFAASVRRWSVEVKDERVLSALQAAHDSLGMKGKPIAVKTCEFTASPMLIGFRASTVLLPETELAPDELEHIFRHELTHYAHRDLWMNLLVLLVSAMHWFNPIVRLMAKTIRTDCEAACDEAVIAGNDTEKRRRYGETIIGFIGIKNAMTPFLSTYFYGGKDSMKKRLASIMDTGHKRRSLAAFCALVVMIMTLLSGNVFAASTAPVGTGEYIGEARAKSIALEHAGISEAQVTFIKAYLDYENGYVVYDVEFYSGSTEYDYEIDAVNGTILEFDRDIEYFSIPANSSATTDAGQYIGEARAKSIALEHAGVSESQITFIKAYLDYDDGYVVYDVDFYSGETEYDYEIDAVNGTVLEYDREIEYYTIPSGAAGGNGASGQSSQQAASGETGYIDEAKAKSIALYAAGLTESQVGYIKVKLDREDGGVVYEVDFKKGWTEYEYEIDAVSGKILKSDIDYDD